MTSAMMLRRLRWIEGAVMPKLQKPMRILFQPGADEPAAWAAHEREIALAKTNGDWFCVVRFIAPGIMHEPIEGVRYFDSDWEAGLAALGPEGAHKLRDSVLGDVFGVATNSYPISVTPLVDEKEPRKTDAKNPR
jgi:hypothetical protein